MLLHREVFDAKNPKHIDEVRYFMNHSKWKNVCPFFLEWPYTTIPDMIKDKFTRYTLGIDNLETLPTPEKLWNLSKAKKSKKSKKPAKLIYILSRPVIGWLLFIVYIF